MAQTPEAGAGAGAEGVQQEQTTFDIFVQNIDLRWCLLLHCDYASLTAIRQVCSAFVRHVPIALNSKEWGISANRAALHAAQWEAGGDDVLHKPLSQQVAQTIVRLQCPDEGAREVALAHGAQLDGSGEPVMVLTHPIGVERTLNATQLSAYVQHLAPFLHDPLDRTTSVVAGATHQRGVQSVSAAPDAIPPSAQDAAEAIATRAFEHSVDDAYDSPFTAEARKNGYDVEWWEKAQGKLLVGGKMDDIAVVVAFLAEKEKCPPPAADPDRDDDEDEAGAKDDDETAP